MPQDEFQFEEPKEVLRIKAKRFVAPTHDAVRAEFARRGLPAIEAEKFFHHYESHGNCRQVHICPECKKVQAHDFIPYGLGRGVVLIDECYDRIVSSNWRGVLLAEKSRTGRNKYYIKKAPRVKQDAFTLTN